MMGLLDALQRGDPVANRGLLDFGLALLSSRGNFANAVGMSGLAGLQGADRYKMQLAALKRAELNDQYIAAQLAEEQQKQKDREAQAAQAAQVQQYLQRLQPVSGINANAVTGITGPRPEAAAAIGQRPQIDPIEAIRLLGPDNARKLIESQNWGRPEVARTADTPAGTIQLDKYGNPVGQALPRYVAPVQVNRGSSIDFVTPAAGMSLPVGMSPEQRDAAARGWANVNLGRERLAWEKGGGANDVADPNQAALIKRFGKPEPGRRWKPDGSLEPIPGGSQDTKQQSTEVGRGSVSDVIASLRTMYNQLDEAGGITNPNNGVFGNLVAGAASSGPGQATGRMFGTQNQSLRNTILQQRPLLMQAIMKASGMSAKQMDSNAELKLYLATATDPTLDVAANKRALDMLEDLYGKGGSGSGSVPKAGDVQDGYRFKGGDPSKPENWEQVK